MNGKSAIRVVLADKNGLTDALVGENIGIAKECSNFINRNSLNKMNFLTDKVISKE